MRRSRSPTVRRTPWRATHPRSCALRTKAMPRERPAAADSERRRRRRLAPEHADCLGVIDHETPAGVGRKTRKRGQLRRPAARRTEAVDDDQRTLTCAPRLSHAPFQRGQITMREGLDRDAIELPRPPPPSARSDRKPRRTRSSCPLGPPPGTHRGTDAASTDTEGRLHRR